MPSIRRISVHVDEPDPGHFYWVLMEEGDEASQWREFESADTPYEMWIDALNAGISALIGYAADERIGPRSAGEHEDSSPVAGPQFLS
jgi:hypothetical protein